jgi:hypothetical protein
VRLQRQPPARSLHHHGDARLAIRLRARIVERLEQMIGEVQPSTSAGSIPAWGQTSFNSCPERWTTCDPARG